MKIFTILIGLLLLTFTACSTAGTASTTSHPQLNGEWKLQNNDNNVLGISNEPITIGFDVEEQDKITGFSGCNYFGGNYVKTQESLIFSEIYTTKRACPDLEVENQFIELLNIVNRFVIKENDLYLYKDNLLLMHFER